MQEISDTNVLFLVEVTALSQVHDLITLDSKNSPANICQAKGGMSCSSLMDAFFFVFIFH